MDGLSREQLTTMVSTIAGVLDSLEIHYAIMGGAAICLITGDPNRRTKDIDLEVFDHQSWPQRPQYDLQAMTVMTMHVNERQVKIFNPAWLLREKILAQHGRQGSAKEQTDIMDLRSLVIFVFWGQPELNFDNGPLKNDLENALMSLLQKRPDLEQPLEQKIKCTAVFGN
jgi:hypothetical protein